jgi:hypothetical protein
MSRALVTLAVGDHGQRVWGITRDRITAYARWLRADLHVIDGGPSAYPLAGKFRLREIVRGYDRTLFLDADCVPVHDAEDIFAAVPADRLGIHDDGPFNEGDWFRELAAKLCESQGWESQPWDGRVYNTGVIVMSRHHAEIFDDLRLPRLKPYPVHHCSEQTLFQLVIERRGVPLHLLDTRWNQQWWFKRRMPSLYERPAVQIRHWAGAGQIDFKRTREQLYAELEAAVAE